MKKRTNVIIVILICAALLVPIPVGYKDGGTVEYNAVLYTARKVHRLTGEGSGYNAGTQVRILFWTVYDDVILIHHQSADKSQALIKRNIAQTSLYVDHELVSDMTPMQNKLSFKRLECPI